MVLVSYHPNKQAVLSYVFDLLTAISFDVEHCTCKFPSISAQPLANLVFRSSSTSSYSHISY